MYSPTATGDENVPGVTTDPAEGQTLAIHPYSEEESINDNDSAIGNVSFLSLHYAESIWFLKTSRL